MREFIYFSNKARTTGNFDSSHLMDAGRMDIAIHTIINAIFLSHKVRDNTKIHLVFNGPPNPPQHLEIFPAGQKTSGSITLSKKNIAGLIKKMLYKSKKEKTTIEPGYEIEKKSLFKVIDDLISQDKEIFILDAKGTDIRKIKFQENAVFVLADQEGFPQKELKKLKSLGEPLSVGKQTYFASQVVTIVNNELDRQNIN
jgi:tRNA (pseudouridine54-N1)-methyltransferase